MRKYLTLLLVYAYSIQAYGQAATVDSIIDKKIYTSFFSFKYKAPLYVTYNLYKGGGDCDRQKEGFTFKVDNCNRCAKSTDYSKSGYEKGHLANAEDFAYKCAYEELTFRYYNCVPQTFELNHGEWLKWEEKIRDMAEAKKLFIIAGSIFGKEKLGKNKVGIPTHCYKIIVDAKTQKVLECLIFPNDKSGSVEDITLTALKKKMGYPLMPKSHWAK